MKQIKVKGLNIVINDKKNMGYSMTNKAQKEFCQYHGMNYVESNNGAVTTKRGIIQSLMFSEFSKFKQQLAQDARIAAYQTEESTWLSIFHTQEVITA